MKPIAVLESRHGRRVPISFYSGGIEALVPDAKVDAYIVSTENGFSPLGFNLSFLVYELGIPEKEIRRLADWNRFENPKVTLVALKSRKKNSILHGVILAASETSESYKNFALPRYGRPYRDFYYNVTYEAIAFACENWEAHNLALSHLSGSGSFHEDIATCNAEALAHYCDATPSADVKSFMFAGCCISHEHFAGIARLNSEARNGRHHQIDTDVEHCDGHVLVHLDWNRDV